MGDRAAAIEFVLRGALLGLPKSIAIAVLAVAVVVVFFAAARRVPINSAFARRASPRSGESRAGTAPSRARLRLGFPIRPAKGARRA